MNEYFVTMKEGFGELVAPQQMLAVIQFVK